MPDNNSSLVYWGVPFGFAFGLGLFLANVLIMALFKMKMLG